jgi:hypothetical protein
VAGKTGAVTLAAADVGANPLLNVTGGVIPLAKLTAGGTNGSITVDTHGRITAYTPPT